MRLSAAFLLVLVCGVSANGNNTQYVIDIYSTSDDCPLINQQLVNDVEQAIYDALEEDGLTVSNVTYLGTFSPTFAPTYSPTASPTESPSTLGPTATGETFSPTQVPSTLTPTANPSRSPSTDTPTTNSPTALPTQSPGTSEAPTVSLSPTTVGPTGAPITKNPTHTPSAAPTLFPTASPSAQPTTQPTIPVATGEPTTAEPTTAEPTSAEPTSAEPTTAGPTTQPTNQPSAEPTTQPTSVPSMTPTGTPSAGCAYEAQQVYDMGDDVFGTSIADDGAKIIPSQGITVELSCLSGFVLEGEAFGTVTCDGDTLFKSKSAECVEIVSYELVYSEYGECSTICNAGIRERTVACISSLDGKDYPEECDAQQVLPLSIPCNTEDAYKCIYRWDTQPADGATCSKGCRGLIAQTARCVLETPVTGELVDVETLGLVAEVVCPGDVSIQAVCNIPEDNAPCPSATYQRMQSSPCSVSCGGGVSTITWACLDETNSPSDSCIGEEPSSTQTCGESPCPVLSGLQWSECSATCGVAVSTRTPVCKEGDAEKSLQLCGASDLLTEYYCDLEDCPEYGFVFFPATECSADCGGGTFTETAVCIDLNGNGASVEDDLCAESKPLDVTLDCNLQKCEEYFWLSVVGDCDVNCGTGKQPIDVRCVTVGSQVTVESEKCTMTKPPTEQSCTLEDCADVSWQGEWGPCSAACGTGERFRDLSCVDSSTGEATSETLCPAEKPASLEECNTEKCPAVYEITELGFCSEACGGGSLTRVIKCIQNGEVVDETECSGSKPAETQPCNLHDCHAWTVSLGECSGTCGEGTQTVTSICQDGLGDVIENPTDGICGGKTKPADVALCETGVTCESWTVTAYGACTESCGTGYMVRGVSCPTQNCNPAVEPASNSTCNPQECGLFKWKVASYGACEASECSNSPSVAGTQSITYDCVSEDTGAVVDDTQCANLVNPPSFASCYVDCPYYSAPSFLACPDHCTTTLTREVHCILKGEEVSDSVCDGYGLTKPDTVFECTNADCGPNARTADSNVCYENQCVCKRGYTGAQCEINPLLTINEVDLVPGSVVYPTDTIPLYYNWEGDPATLIKVLAVRKSDSATFYFEAAATYSSPKELSIPSGMPAGAYTIRVEISEDIYADWDSSFNLETPCALYTCGSNGRRNESACELKACICDVNYSGDTCGIFTEPGCDFTCVHGKPSSDCTSCVECGAFTGPSCDKCEITCDTSSTISLTECSCELTTQTTEFMITGVNLSGAAWEEANLVNVVTIDLANAGFEATSITIVEYDSTEKTVTCSAKLLVDAQETVTARRRLLGVSERFSQELADPDSEMNNGVLTRNIDKDSVVVETLNPTKQPTQFPTQEPTQEPTTEPTRSPQTESPTLEPTGSPTLLGTIGDVCENKWASLSCPTGVIHVRAATFGSMNKTACNNFNRHLCPPEDVLTTVATRCDNKKSCDIYVSPSLLGEPCQGSLKYLTLSYLCEFEGELIEPNAELLIEPDKTVAFSHACAGAQVEMGPCPEGTEIQVQSATFGRNDDENDPSWCDDSEGTCSSEVDVLSYYQGRCDGHAECQAPTAYALLNTVYPYAGLCTSGGYLTGGYMCV